MRWVSRWLALALFTGLAAPAAAQSEGPGVSIEGYGGWAGFVDDATINHGVLGGAARIQLTPHLSLGPEVTYMVGPGNDRDLFLIGALTYDFRDQRGVRPRVSPFLVVGGGLMNHRDRFGSSDFSSSEGAVTGGVGVRVFVTDRLYLAPEVRVGWEPHVRVGVVAGFRLRP